MGRNDQKRNSFNLQSRMAPTKLIDKEAQLYDYVF